MLAVNANLRSQFMKILARAGVKPWPKLFHNLRGTRQTELSETRMAVVEGGACFWHLVDLLWIVLFPLLYLVA